MPARPLLVLPAPRRAEPPRGNPPRNNTRFPSKDRQGERFGPIFERLRASLTERRTPLELREDPTSLAPDRVIVFEIAGTIADFIAAVRRIEGLEFMAEYDTEFAADEDFVMKDTRKGREGQYRQDKNVPGRLYLAMPDTQALEQLVNLWHSWQRGEGVPRGSAAFRHLFQQLRDLRPWGPQDRIPEDTFAYWREETERDANKPVRTEIELWFRNSEGRRAAASRAVRDLVTESGGTTVDEKVIPEIAYHGFLIDISAAEVRRLVEHKAVRLALADDVMFLRPQSTLTSPSEIDVGEGAPVAAPDAGSAAAAPIAALLDGVPVQAHALLDGRIILDDPDGLQERATVARRIHGTAMASLILHGDRNRQDGSIVRPLYVQPILIVDENGYEYTDRDHLVIDTLYRAITRIKGTETQAAAAPTVFVINLSLADTRRPFSGMVSPLARLLDFMADRYNLLFLVSGGNVPHDLAIGGFETWAAFEGADPATRQRAVLSALNDSKHDRTILSPAESLNALTIGGHHHDDVGERVGAQHAVDPFQDSTLPNISSGLGLGYRRMVKPELYFPGGREFVKMKATGNGLRVSVGAPQRLYGLRSAAPDPSGHGRLDYTALSNGTSSATALGTRAAHIIFAALMDREGGSMLYDIEPEFYAVVMKCLLAHSAGWNGNDELLKEICGPEDKRRHVERSENSCRFIGFGIPNIDEVIECAENRATLVGYGALRAGDANVYRIPLPSCLEGVTDPRSLTVTVAWFSPVKAGHRNYRGIKLEAAPVSPPKEVLGVERHGGQPADAAVKRGTIFHERFTGEAAVPFIDDGHLALQVWCKEDAGGHEEEVIRYGIAITLRAGTAIPVYDQIQERLRIRPQAEQ
jgi:hypothetical protein